jgi:ABC-type multidrug transport system fused ATPase/permease subunit
VLLVVGTITAVAAGVPFPVMGILFGQLVDDLNGATCAASSDASGFTYSDTINTKVVALVGVSIALFVLLYTYTICWSILSQRLASRLRERYFRSLLRQEPAFFDSSAGTGAAAVSSRLQADIAVVQAGTSEKVGLFIGSVCFFLTAYIIAFVKEPRLAGMLVSMVPAFVIMSLVGGIFVQRFSMRASDAMAAAASIASEALGHVGVVQVFGAASRLEARFADHMQSAREAGIRKAFITSIQAGLLYFIAYSANALAFWQGSKMIADAMAGQGDGSSVGRIYTVILILVDGEYPHSPFVSSSQLSLTCFLSTSMCNTWFCCSYLASICGCHSCLQASAPRY